MRFNQVFYLLLAISAISAFVLPQRVTDRAKPMATTLLTPVAHPSRSLASWALGRGENTAPDTRPAATIVAENLELKQSVAKLTFDLAELRRLNKERDNIGDIRELCTPVAVIGSDSTGSRQSLTLRSSTLAGLTDRMIVLHKLDVVGMVTNAGVGGAQARLVTDPQSRVRAHFASFVKVQDTPGRPADEEVPMQFINLNLPPMLVEGAGNGRMICRNIPFADTEKALLSAGAWCVVDDPDWPKEVQGRRLGIVTKIDKGAKMMAEIEIRPDNNLLLLQEVMVLTRGR